MFKKNSNNLSRIFLGLLLIISLLTVTVCYADKAATTLTISVVPQNPDDGMPYTVSGKLTAGSEPLGNKKIILETTSTDQLNDGSYSNIAQTETKRDGSYWFYRPRINGEKAVKVIFIGNDLYNGAQSNPIVVNPVPNKDLSGKTGSIMIMSDPQGADIYIDEIMSGVTPTTVGKLSAGPHDMILVKEGYQNESVEIYIAPEETVTTSISLNPAGLGLTQSGASAHLTMNKPSIYEMMQGEPIFAYNQNTLGISVYQNASVMNNTQVSVRYTNDSFGKGYSIAVTTRD